MEESLGLQAQATKKITCNKMGKTSLEVGLRRKLKNYLLTEF